MRTLIAALNRVINCGFAPDTDIPTFRRVRLVAVMSLLPAVAGLVFAAGNAFNGKLVFAALDLAAVVILGGNYMYMCVRKNLHVSAVFLSVVSMVLSVYLLLHGGADGTGYVWCLFFPITVSFVLGARVGAIVNVGFFLFATVVLYVPDNPLLLLDYSPGLKGDLLSALAAVSLIAWYSEHSRGVSEKQLRLSERRYRALIETSSTVYAITAPDGTVLYESPSLTRVYGYTPEELVGRNIVELVHPDDVPLAMQGMKQLLENPGQEHSVEVRYRHKNGSWRSIEVSGVSLLHDPAVQGVVLTSHDITELRSLTDTLEERVRSRTKELRESQIRLHHAEKMQAIGQLAGGIAHDFNNQLAGIMGCADWLRVSLDKDPELRECAEAILTAARDADSLTSQLLAFARRGQYESAPVNVHTLVADVVTLLERSIDRRVAVEQHLTAHRAVILGDHAQLQNALLNVALNARDAMPDGGTISISTDTLSVGDEGRPGTPNDLGPGEYLRIEVRDTGEGMAPEVAARAFEPFFTTKPQGAGTGMGLAAVYGTVQTHGGQLDLSSEPGKGTSVAILLRLADDAPDPDSDSPAESHSLTRGSGGILVIDDDNGVARMIKMVLGGLGYTVHRCSTGDEAVKWYGRAHASVDVILLDMVMPGLSATETFRRLREVRPDAKVILSSGFSINSTVQGLLQAGALCFIKKPYEVSELTQRLAEATASDSKRT